MRAYPFISILVIAIVLYFSTYFLARFKKIKIITHRKIWNIFLLLSFLATGFFGIVLTIEINQRTILLRGFNVLFWHVETGIIMVVLAVFHIFWHWNYFKRIFK